MQASRSRSQALPTRNPRPESTIVAQIRYAPATNRQENPMNPLRMNFDLSSRFAAGRASLAVLLAGAVLLSAPGRADDAAAAGGPGTWQSHKYTFQFLGFTSTYSCDGLADKLRVVLLAAGARSDVKSQPGACASGFGRPDRFARADLTFYTLAPSDPSAAAASAVKGNWRPITFAARQPRELGVGDCELIDQFRQQVLPMFTTRNLVNNTTCIPHQDSGSTIDLKFESFTAVPGKKPAGAASGGT
jgi:hypothetical protein